MYTVRTELIIFFAYQDNPQVGSNIYQKENKVQCSPNIEFQDIFATALRHVIKQHIITLCDRCIDYSNLECGTRQLSKGIIARRNLQPHHICIRLKRNRRERKRSLGGKRCAVTADIKDSPCLFCPRVNSHLSPGKAGGLIS